MTTRRPVPEQIDRVFKDLFSEPPRTDAEVVRRIAEACFEAGRAAEKADQKTFERWVMSGTVGEMPPPTENPYKK